MIDRLNRYIKEEGLINSDDHVLLTISGGKDSMCMLYLFLQLDYNFSIAHCNFCLRGLESDEDQLFVQEIAEHYNISFYTKNFETAQYANKNNLSIQMAARELRYEWFNKLGFDKIATAHHQDDSIETFLIKKNRKSSLEALRGIPLVNGNVIRPMLGFSSQEIKDFVLLNKIKFREDSSNNSIEYDRNQIRLKLLPDLEKQNPNIRKEILLEIENNKIKYSELLLELSSISKRAWLSHSGYHELLFEELLSHPDRNELLYQILKPFGPFPWSDVFELLNANSGKKIENHKYRLLKNRSSLLVSRKQEFDHKNITISEDLNFIDSPIRLSFSITNKIDSGLFLNSSIACLDYNKLSFPLVLRRWEQGDFFVPIGMEGRKKVSDYMIDEKFSILEKENTWVLCSQGEIVWLVGHRLNDRYKLVAETEKVYLVELLEHVK